jgi:hypothetical protein
MMSMPLDPDLCIEGNYSATLWCMEDADCCEMGDVACEAAPTLTCDGISCTGCDAVNLCKTGFTCDAGTCVTDCVNLTLSDADIQTVTDWIDGGALP